MQKIAYCLIFLVSIFNKNFLYAQPDSPLEDYVINFNYQNELRIEWPAGTYVWSVRNLEESIRLTEKYSSFILNNIKEIEYEMGEDKPLDIKLYEFGGLITMDINKSSRPVSYLFKDSLLLFTGLHVIYLINEDKQPVSISFDNIEGLSKLEVLNMQNIMLSLKKDLRGEPLFTKKKLNKITELMYRQEENEMMFVGQLEEKNKRIYTIRGMFGAQLAPGNIGIAAMPEFAIINYRINKLGESYVDTKHSFLLRATVFKEAGSLSLKYAHLSSVKIKDEFILYGTGIGIYHLKNDEGDFQYGPAVSFHGEGTRITTEVEIGIPVVNRTSIFYMNITIGLKF